MGQLVNLILQRLRIFLMAVSQRLYGDAGRKVQIFFSVHIVKMHALSMVEHHRITVIRMQDGFLRLFDI